MPAINPLPTPPSRNDPANFSDRADAFLAALPAYTNEANALLDDVHTSRDTVQGLRDEVMAAGLASAATNAATATTKAAEASASAAEAFGYLQAYRATSYGALASDPVVDPNGNPPTVGDEYFNTTMNLLKRFNGVTWQASDIATADLAAPGGSALVGADDGAGGSLWATVAGFIAFLLSSIGASVIGCIQAGVGAIRRSVQDKLRDTVSVKDFGAVGDGVTDDTAAIQAALNGTVRRIFFPPGKYRITSTLIVGEDFIIEGCGGTDEIETYDITEIQVDGDFDGIAINASAPGYYGWLTMKRISIRKTGGSTKTNSGLKSANFAPHVILETVTCRGFNIGFDMWLGIAQLNGCNARFNNVGFNLKGTSLTIQNCYAERNVTGYRINEQTVYSTLISCAADGNTGNAYEFIGTSGPFVTQYAAVNSVVRMQNCGAEVGSRYVYVDGNFQVDISSPTVAQMSGLPSFAWIESARNVTMRGLGIVPATNWLRVNTTKCTQDVIAIEGDFPSQNLVTPPTPTYGNVPASTFGEKTAVGCFALAKTRIPYITPNPRNNSAGAGAGQASFLYKGMFAAQAQASNRVRFRVKVLGNGFGASARIRLSQIQYMTGAGDVGSDVYLSAANSGGIANAASKTSADITVTRSSAPSPDGFTYRYFFVESAYNFAYLWDVSAICLFEQFKADMFSDYNNWTVTNAEATTTGSITAGTPTLVVASGTGIADGMQILVNGAGAAGGVLVTNVVSGGGTTSITLAANAATTVTSSAVSVYIP